MVCLLLGNELNKSHMKLLSDALPSLPRLQHLLLDDMEVSPAASRSLATALLGQGQQEGESVPPRALQTLSMCSCEMSGGSALSICLALCQLPAFQQVHLDGNCFSATAVQHLQSIMAAAGKACGSFGDNNEADEDEDDFAAALENMNCI